MSTARLSSVSKEAMDECWAVMGTVAVVETVMAKAGYGRDTVVMVDLAGVSAVAFVLDGAVGDASVAATATVASDFEGHRPLALH